MFIVDCNSGWKKIGAKGKDVSKKKEKAKTAMNGEERRKGKDKLQRDCYERWILRGSAVGGPESPILEIGTNSKNPKADSKKKFFQETYCS
uniref:Uncharacterized protein n=1 Tax=Romanomermis culicivorax TaxID=13658 RepID=A0A915J1Z8_ROMCU